MIQGNDDKNHEHLDDDTPFIGVFYFPHNVKDVTSSDQITAINLTLNRIEYLEDLILQTSFKGTEALKVYDCQKWFLLFKNLLTDERERLMLLIAGAEMQGPNTTVNGYR